MNKKNRIGDQKDTFEYDGFTITHNHKIEDRKFINHMVGTKLIKNQEGEDQQIKVEAMGYSYKEAKQKICKEIDLINESNNYSSS